MKEQEVVRSSEWALYVTDKIACGADLGFAEEEIVEYCSEQVHSFTWYCHENCNIIIPHLHTDGEDAVRGKKSWHGRGKRVWMIGNGCKASQGNLIVSQIKGQSENQRHNESNNKYRYDSRSPSRPLREGQSPNSLSSSMLCSSSQILFPNLPKQSRGCHTEERSGYSIRTHS